MSEPRRTLILSNSFDAHVDQILPHLQSRGCQPFRLDLDAFPRDYEITQSEATCANDSLRHLPSGAEILMSEVRSVWTRKSAEFTFRCDSLPEQQMRFARMEAEHILSSLTMALDCYWMNHPSALRAALWKGEQVRRAKRMGFRVPATIVTNAPDQLVRFRAEVRGDIVFKAMSTPDLAASEVSGDERSATFLPTTIIDDDLAGLLGAVAEVPCLFQEYVVKQYEIRATVIGKSVFAAKINSQDDARTKIDCRDMAADILYEAFELPPDISRRCIELVASYGLNFGALDLIVTPDDEYVFLENNPGGQFLYVQELVPSLDMLTALVECLARGHHD